MHIRAYDARDLDEIVQLSVLAWAPVFASFRKVLGAEIYARVYPDWQKTQSEVVESICRDTEKHSTLVAEVEGTVAGFLVYELREASATGEVQLLAVHPDHQNRGIGTALNLVALQKMQEAGMRVAEVGTGGEEGHAPARRSYEKAGYRPLPLVRYYKAL